MASEHGGEAGQRAYEKIWKENGCTEDFNKIKNEKIRRTILL